MPTAAKANVIEQTKERYQRSRGVLFTEYRGLKVHELQHLRRELGKKGGDIHVVKNTLFRLAAGDAASELPESLSSGPTAVAFIYENEAECAKVLVDFAKTNKNLVVKGGLISGKVFDDKQVENLSKLPPREVLIAQVIGAIAAPLTNLVGVIEALYAQPIRTIYAVADKANEGVEAAAPAAEAPTEVVAEAAPEPEATTEEAPVEETPAPADDAAAPTEETPTETQE